MRKACLKSVKAMLAWHMGERTSPPVGQGAKEFDEWLLRLSPEAAEAVFQHGDELVRVLESGAAADENENISAELDAALAVVMLGGGR